MSSTTSIAIGVPTASYLTAIAAVEKNKTTLELLLNIQKSLDEFKIKVLEMDEEMQSEKDRRAYVHHQVFLVTISARIFRLRSR